MAVAELYVVCAFGNTTTNRFDGHRALCNSADNTMKIQGNSNSDGWQAPKASVFYEELPYKNGEVTTTELALPMSITLWRFSRTNAVSKIWRLMGGQNSYQFWEGPVGEMIFTDGTEDLAEQQKFEGYLAWKWGLEGDLPNDHPYKNEVPYHGLRATLIMIR
jgi:hypothetical protein